MKRFLVLAFALLLASSAWATSASTTCIIRDATAGCPTCGVKITEVTFSFTAATGGAYSSCTTPQPVTGLLVMAESVPGTPTPSAFGCTLKDPAGYDVMGGAVTGASSTATQRWLPVVGSVLVDAVPVDGVLTFAATGNGTSGAKGYVTFTIIK